MISNHPLPSLFIDKNTNIVSAGYITQKELYQFRLSVFESDSKRSYPGAKSLSLDVFDPLSLHIIFINGGKIFGSARIVRTDNEGNLPFSLLFKDIKPQADDLELGRFLTISDRLGKKAFVYMLPVIAFALSCVPILDKKIRLYADVLTGHPRTLNRSTYLEFGFTQKNITCYDHDYNLSSELFVLEPENIGIFMKSINKYQPFVGKLRISTSVTKEFIINYLLTNTRYYNIHPQGRKIRHFA